MGKHIADKGHEQDKDGRLEHYSEIERTTSDEPGKASKALHRKAKKLDDEERMKRFLDIERSKD